MDWYEIGILLIALGALSALLDWLSRIRQGHGSETGKPEMVFHLVVTFLALMSAVWLVMEHKGHLALLYVLPALGQGGALVLMSPKGEGEWAQRVLLGFVWPLSTLLIVAMLREGYPGRNGRE